MADLGEEVKVSGVFGGVQFGNTQGDSEIECGNGQTIGGENIQNAGTIRNENLPAVKTTGFWSKFKSFWLQEIDWNREIKIELTPRQQEIGNNINEFLHQEITWEKVHDFLFQEITFGKNKK